MIFNEFGGFPKDGNIIYDCFAKIITKHAPMAKKAMINDFISIYKKVLSLNKHSRIFTTEKCSHECTKMPPILENSYILEELEKMENFSKNEKNLFFILSILPKTKFYPNLYDIPVEIYENSILFDSRFECGNLRRVCQVR